MVGVKEDSIKVCPETQVGGRCQEDKEKAVQERAGQSAKALTPITNSSNSINAITRETYLVKGLTYTC